MAKSQANCRGNRRRCLVGLLLLSLCPGAIAAERPHVLLIVADDLGYGDPGCYNAESKIPTPHIDQLAVEGMRFTDAHAPAAVCVPTRFGLMTGCYPFRMPDVPRDSPLIDEGMLTIASLLGRSGYHTEMVGKWHLGFESRSLQENHFGGPVDRGFDGYFGIPRSLDLPPYYYIQDRIAVAAPTARIAANDSVDEGWSPIQGAFWREGGISPEFRHIDVLPRLTEEAVSVVERHAVSDPKRPLFLYFALPAPHTPWLPTDPYQGKSSAGMYGDFAIQVDDCIGRVLAAFAEHGLSEDTLVVFTSDNGPVWYADDAEKFDHQSAGPLRGMKGDAYEGGHRVPMIVTWPGHISPGSVSHHLVCHVDLLRTLAAIVEIELTEEAGVDSHNLMPALSSNSEDGLTDRVLISQSSKGVLAVRQGPWKLIPTHGSGGFSDVPAGGNVPPGQLYRLDRDIGETTNLWNDHPEVVERLTGVLNDIKSGERTAP